MKTILLIIALCPSITIAANKIIHQKLNFKAIGKPAFIKASGSIPLQEIEIKLKENKISGKFTANMTKLNSGIELRDEHLTEKYLHVNKFPVATFTFDEQIINLDSDTQKLKGKFLFHGKEQDKEVEVMLNKNGEILDLKTEFKIKLTDYDIDLPSFQGITAADTVNIKLESKIGL